MKRLHWATVGAGHAAALGIHTEMVILRRHEIADAQAAIRGVLAAPIGGTDDLPFRDSAA